MTENTQTGPGSTGNVIAALCNVFIPGLGHLVQGRIFGAIFYFISIPVLYFLYITIPIAAILHLWAIISAALYKPES